MKPGAWLKVVCWGLEYRVILRFFEDYRESEGIVGDYVCPKVRGEAFKGKGGLFPFEKITSIEVI